MIIWQRQIPWALIACSHPFFLHACAVHQFHNLLDGQQTMCPQLSMPLVMAGA